MPSRSKIFQLHRPHSPPERHEMRRSSRGQRCTSRRDRPHSPPERHEMRRSSRHRSGTCLRDRPCTKTTLPLPRTCPRGTRRSQSRSASSARPDKMSTRPRRSRKFQHCTKPCKFQNSQQPSRVQRPRMPSRSKIFQLHRPHSPLARREMRQSWRHQSSKSRRDRPHKTPSNQCGTCLLSKRCTCTRRESPKRSRK